MKRRWKATAVLGLLAVGGCMTYPVAATSVVEPGRRVSAEATKFSFLWLSPMPLETASRLLDELVERPRVGNTVVTTLNLEWQKRAEKVLKNGCERGAFVVVDIQTGEVLVMASRPT